MDVTIIELKQVAETPLALILRDRQGNEAVIPKSQINYSLKINEELKIKIPEWLAKKLPFDYE